MKSRKGKGKGREARSTTAEEFEDVMQLAVVDTRQQMQELGDHPVPKYSWDNNRINKSARLSAMGLQEGDVVPLPTYSPDFHQIIEHAIAQFKHALLAAVMEHSGQPMTAAKAQQLAVEVFEQFDAQSIAENEVSLVCCWQQVATPLGEQVKCYDGVWRNGTGGDWAEAPLR